MVEVRMKRMRLYHKYRVFLRSGGHLDGTVVCRKGGAIVLRQCRDAEGKEYDRCVLLKRDISVIAQTEPYNLNAKLYMEDGWGEILFGIQNDPND